MVDDEQADEPERSGDKAPWTYWVGAQCRRDGAAGMSRSAPLVERRRRPPPSTPLGYLHDVPASVILDRLPVPMLAVRLDGVLTYANPAFVRMLGHADTATLIERSLPDLLAGDIATEPRSCVTALQTAGITAVAWYHAEGFPIHTAISAPLLTRVDDPVLLISVTDISDVIWNTALQQR